MLSNFVWLYIFLLRGIFTFVSGLSLSTVITSWGEDSSLPCFFVICLVCTVHVCRYLFSLPLGAIYNSGSTCTQNIHCLVILKITQDIHWVTKKITKVIL